MAPLSPTPQADGAPIERYRHRARGTTYRVLARGVELQSTAYIAEGSPVVVYQGEDGRIWVRYEADFDDDRFERLPNVENSADHRQKLDAALPVGTPVRKHTGDYQIDGVIRGHAVTQAGLLRYVVEHRAEGGGSFLHIYAPANLVVREGGR